MSASLLSRLPWTKSPLIINAPMAGFANGALAAAVTLAGGLGQIGSVNSADELDSNLSHAAAKLTRTSGLLPLGVGFLPFAAKLDVMLPVLAEWQPAVAWLFAARQFDDYALWAREVRAAVPGVQVWVQVGSVAAAVEVARAVGPDVLCVQGIDAGGHGFEKGAGVISLLPEIADALEAAGYGGIGLVAAGGIVDGRGVAAALALGAQGVVMGTRFLAAGQTVVAEGHREAILDARDGGQSTVRSKVFDELKGPNVWPAMYDGRGIATRSYQDHVDGTDIEELRRRLAEDVKEKHKGLRTEGQGRATIWAGTGVGLVRKQKQPAGEIVEEVRNGAIEAMGKASARL